MSEILAFGSAVLGNWAMWLGGTVSTLIGLYERRRGEIHWRYYGWFLLACFLFASFSAWQTEYEQRLALVAERASLEGERRGLTAQIQTKDGRILDLQTSLAQALVKTPQ